MPKSTEKRHVPVGIYDSRHWRNWKVEVPKIGSKNQNQSHITLKRSIQNTDTRTRHNNNMGSQIIHISKLGSNPQKSKSIFPSSNASAAVSMPGIVFPTSAQYRDLRLIQKLHLYEFVGNNKI
jgi:hypothetical protein